MFFFFVCLFFSCHGAPQPGTANLVVPCLLISIVGLVCSISVSVVCMFVVKFLSDTHTARTVADRQTTSVKGKPERVVEHMSGVRCPRSIPWNPPGLLQNVESSLSVMYLLPRMAMRSLAHLHSERRSRLLLNARLLLYNRKISRCTDSSNSLNSFFFPLWEIRSLVTRRRTVSLGSVAGRKVQVL